MRKPTGTQEEQGTPMTMPRAQDQTRDRVPPNWRKTIPKDQASPEVYLLRCTYFPYNLSLNGFTAVQVKIDQNKCISVT